MYKSTFFLKRLFADTVSTNKKIFADTLSANNKLFAERDVPIKNQREKVYYMLVFCRYHLFLTKKKLHNVMSTNDILFADTIHK